MRFQEACKAWASSLQVSKSVVFKIAGSKRKTSTSWAKERYYGGILAKDEDIAWARLGAIENEVASDVASAVSQLSACVSKMCYQCVGAELAREGKSICPDGQCPLRPVSPIKLTIKQQ
jgi:hypothetical protein